MAFFFEPIYGAPMNLAFIPFVPLVSTYKESILIEDTLAFLLLFFALMLFMTNLLATSAKPTIVLHKTSLVRSKGRIAFLGGIAQSLFVDRSSLVTKHISKRSSPS